MDQSLSQSVARFNLFVKSLSLSSVPVWYDNAVLWFTFLWFVLCGFKKGPSRIYTHIFRARLIWFFFSFPPSLKSISCAWKLIQAKILVCLSALSRFNVEASDSFNVYFAVQEDQKVAPDIFRSEADVVIHCTDVNSKGFNYFCLDFNPIVIHIPKPMVGSSLQKELNALVSTSSMYRCLQLLEITMSHSRVSVWRSFL